MLPPPQSILAVAFPAVGALVAGAASQAKARCEVDLEATKAASESFAEAGITVRDRGSIFGRDRLEPIRAVLGLIVLTVKSVKSAGKKIVSAHLKEGTQPRSRVCGFALPVATPPPPQDKFMLLRLGRPNARGPGWSLLLRPSLGAAPTASHLKWPMLELPLEKIR